MRSLQRTLDTAYAALAKKVPQHIRMISCFVGVYTRIEICWNIHSVFYNRKILVRICRNTILYIRESRKEVSILIYRATKASGRKIYRTHKRLVRSNFYPRIHNFHRAYHNWHAYLFYARFLNTYYAHTRTTVIQFYHFVLLPHALVYSRRVVTRESTSFTFIVTNLNCCITFCTI